jgi:hypothetical protein
MSPLLILVTFAKKYDLDFKMSDLYTPLDWSIRGESYGTESELVVTHDGGCWAPFMSHDYQEYSLMEKLNKALEEHGYYVEQCTGWYSAIYEI